MSIRRKSTTHDLATLRLHPDGSRVQQSSVNARHRTAGSTLVDFRGNWIAKDAGGKSSVKTRRSISALHSNDAQDDRPAGEQDARHKGKQRARDGQDEDPEEWRSNTRSRRRLSFMRDLSFLDPAPASVLSLTDAEVTFPDPPSDLLKSIHHFASCYYRERGQLLDSSRDYRGMKKERRKSRNIHTIAVDTLKDQSSDPETETEDESTEEDESVDAEDSGKEGAKNKSDAYSKDMYKAFDGSALVAIGIVLQEYVAHTLSSRPEVQSTKRARTG